MTVEDLSSWSDFTVEDVSGLNTNPPVDGVSDALLDGTNLKPPDGSTTEALESEKSSLFCEDSAKATASGFEELEVVAVSEATDLPNTNAFIDVTEEEGLPKVNCVDVEPNVNEPGTRLRISAV